MFYQDDKVEQWLRLVEGEKENKFKESNETASRLLEEMIQK